MVEDCSPVCGCHRLCTPQYLKGIFIGNCTVWCPVQDNPEVARWLDGGPFYRICNRSGPRISSIKNCTDMTHKDLNMNQSRIYGMRRFTTLFMIEGTHSSENEVAFLNTGCRLHKYTSILTLFWLVNYRSCTAFYSTVFSFIGC